ncbi:MAG: ATP-binding protein [Desulfobacterales bacterium]|jgi:signal transduction histidine kinase
MHWTIGYFRSKERVTVLITFLVLTGFMSVLLIANYRSLQKLRESSRRQHQYEVEKRARDLGQFFNEQRRNVFELVENGRVRLYFENKALGMSMEYGLGSTLAVLGGELKAFIARNRMGENPVYHRVAFVDHDNRIIADSHSGSMMTHPDSNWKQSLQKQTEGYYVSKNANNTHHHIVYTRPFYFKDQFVGRLVAWLDVDTIYHQLLIPGTAARLMGLVCKNENFLLEGALDEGGSSQGTLDYILTEEELADRVASFQQLEKVISFRVPINHSVFEVFEIASSKLVLGATSPKTLLLTMALMAVALLGGAAIVARMIGHNMVLHTRIEESKKREWAIEQKNAELESQIEERIRTEKERKRLEAQLQRAHKMEVIGLLAGGVAHDLNNILSGLVSYPELLLMDLPEDSSFKNAITTIQRSGEKAAAIVQDLLTLARRGVSASEVVNLNTIISDYLTTPEFKKLIQFHPRIQLEVDLHPKLLNIAGSPVHLSKTIMNLVSNAAEAMPSGGRLRIESENCYIDRPIKGYDAVEEGDYVVCRVIDQGIGIPEGDLEKVFEPFYTKKVMGRSGTGLGMAVVWGTIKDHEGYIDVKSVVGRGTTFTMYFPVTRAKGPQNGQRAPLEEIRGRGETILLVDDVEEQRRIASRMLEKLDYRVVTAQSGNKALEYLETHAADLVVLDMIMDPGPDGLDTYRAIIQTRRDQKAVIASGFSETDRVKEAQRLGAGEYIRKPYTLETLGVAVKNALAS